MRESTRTMIGTVFIFLFVTELVSALIYSILELFNVFALHAGDESASPISYFSLYHLILLLIVILVYILIVRKTNPVSVMMKNAVVRKTSGWLLSLSGFILLASWLPLLAYGIRLLSSADASSSSASLSIFLYYLIANLLIIGQISIGVALLAGPGENTPISPDDIMLRNARNQTAIGVSLLYFIVTGAAAVLHRIIAIFPGKWSLLAAKVQYHLPVIVVIIAVVFALIWITRRERWHLQEFLKIRTITSTSGALIALCGLISIRIAESAVGIIILIIQIAAGICLFLANRSNPEKPEA